ncbi:MAG: cyanophycin synthetase family protein, partial [Gemmatimonadaceae bacterium]
MSTATAPQIDADQLQVSRIRALRGPNYWRLAPVIACDVQLGSLEQVSSADIPGFYERLTEAIPTLAEHHCTRQEAGGFLERLREGTHLPHILEHVALELQSLAGCDVSFGRVVPSGDADTWWVIVAYEEEEVGLQSMRDAVKILRACIAEQPVDVEAIVEQLLSLYESVRLGPSTAAVVEEAKRRGIPVRRLNNYSLVQLGLGKNLRRIQATLSDYTSAIAVEIAQDKDDTKRVLGNIGLPVPKGDVARSFERAVEIADEIGYPVILKPLDANQGRGISGQIDNEHALHEAWNEAREFGDRIVIEQYAEGRDHRVLVINGKVVACAERIPARVTGDGSSTIAQLIERENRDPRRGVGHTKTLTKLPADERTTCFLRKQGLTLESAPQNGQVVYLRGTANLSTGGTAVDRTAPPPPPTTTACEMAAGIIGLDIAGIDL